jgi:hypothetical protein
MKALSPFIVLLVIGASGYPSPASAQDSDAIAAEAEALNNYNTAIAAGRRAEAARYILEYMEDTRGEHDPQTVALTHSYGNLLRQEGDILEALSVLKKARKRAIAAHGKHGIELFQINLDLGDAYVDHNKGVRRPQRYFDEALEVLRENGQHETVLYVTALVGIASRLTIAGALEGGFSADTNGDGLAELDSFGTSRVIRRYLSEYGVLEEYLEEASELAEALELEDPYLSAKISVVAARIKVRENIFLDSVPLTVRGSVSNETIEENYQREDGNLAAAAESLANDAELNQQFLDIANNSRMEIAWLSEDLGRMKDFCSSDVLNMASRYPPERLYEIADDGTVIAPRFSFFVARNIFDQLKTRVIDGRLTNDRYTNWGPNAKVGEKPAFVPVCIDGRLMAALVYAPTVTIEDIGENEVIE